MRSSTQPSLISAAGALFPPTASSPSGEAMLKTLSENVCVSYVAEAAAKGMTLTPLTWIIP